MIFIFRSFLKAFFGALLGALSGAIFENCSKHFHTYIRSNIESIFEAFSWPYREHYSGALFETLLRAISWILLGELFRVFLNSPLAAWLGYIFWALFGIFREHYWAIFWQLFSLHDFEHNEEPFKEHSSEHYFEHYIQHYRENYWKHFFEYCKKLFVT